MITKINKRVVAGVTSYLLLLTSYLFISCSPDSFEGANPNGIPSIDGVDFQLSVDQETNQMTANYTPKAGTYPIWILDGTQYSTLQEVGYKNSEAGSHTVELKLGNRNGFSQGGVKKQYTFNNTIIDYSADFRRITGKHWRFANKEAGHLACGPSGTAGTEWWSAAPDEKKGTGMYDDRISFTEDNAKGGTFNYDAGADGLTYVNYGTKFNTEGATADIDVALGNQTSTWSFEPGVDSEGNSCTYIVLAANTRFPYISDDKQYENPRFRIETLTAKKLVLVYDNPGAIAWHFIFTSEEAEQEWSGFDANSDFNMWKNVEYTMFFWYAPGWSQIADPGFDAAGNDYTITLPEATTDQWQAQVAFKTTNISTNAATNYDFSCIINSDKDLNGATVKLVMDGDDNVFYFADRIDLKAGEDYIFWKGDMPGIDMERVNLFFDFGGCQADTHINISNIVLKDHANDDGTKPPYDDPDNPDNPDGPVMDWDYESSSNLWKAVDDGTLFDAFGYWFADNGWGELPVQPVATHTGDTYEITLPEGMGGSQWQGQFHIDTKLTASAAKAYNFYLVMETDADCPGVTIKLTDSGDTNFFCEGRHDVKGDEPFIFKVEGATLKDGIDASALRLFFDFGGSPAGTHVKISKIYFEEAVILNYDDAENLWRGVDDGSVGSSMGYWFADNGWGELPVQPVATHKGDTYEITLPEGMGGSQWQGQFHIDTKLTASAAKQYHFQLVMEADADCPGVTIKLTDAGDTNFFCEGRHDVKADEPFVYTLKYAQLKEGTDASAIRLFFDFGGSPASTHVKISKIIFKEAK